MPNLRPLSADLQQVAIAELNEVPERLDADLEALRTWIAQTPHLRSRTDDQFLVAFLRGCKFSLEKAKTKLEKYYTLKTRYPNLYTIRDVTDPRVLELVGLGVGYHLPTPLHGNGPRLLYVRTGCYDASRFNFDDIIAVSSGLNALTLVNDDYAMVNGIVVILDFAEITTAHIMQMTPTVMKRMSVFSEEALPLRERAMHMINTSSTFEKAFNLIKPFMPAKQQARLYVHGNNMETLYEHVPLKYLPIDLGGENGTIAAGRAELTEQFVKEHSAYLKEELNFGTDEKLRPPGTAIDYDAIFGVEGSFRKLNVD